MATTERPAFYAPLCAGCGSTFHTADGDALCAACRHVERERAWERGAQDREAYPADRRAGPTTAELGGDNLTPADYYAEYAGELDPVPCPECSAGMRPEGWGWACPAQSPRHRRQGRVWLEGELDAWWTAEQDA